jgi:hypothetical protein
MSPSRYHCATVLVEIGDECKVIIFHLTVSEILKMLDHENLQAIYFWQFKCCPLSFHHYESTIPLSSPDYYGSALISEEGDLQSRVQNSKLQLAL